MIGDKIGVYDVNTGTSLRVERYVDLGRLCDGESVGLAYTTAGHGRLVQIRCGCLRVLYDIDGEMIGEDADRIARWLGMPAEDALRLIRERAS